MNKKRKGILITVEGGDGSGKATQAGLLKSRIEEAGFTVSLFSFPRYYESQAGKLTGELLAGKYGDFISADPRISSLSYVLDRAGAAREIQSKLDAGHIVLCDRYTPSNLAHQSGKLSAKERPEFIEFIEELEYGELHIPKPSMVLYLSVSTDLSYELVDKKGDRGYLSDNDRKRDLAEGNTDHQDKTREVYIQLASERDDWVLVECMQDGQMSSREDIHTKVWEHVSGLLGTKLTNK